MLKENIIDDVTIVSFDKVTKLNALISEDVKLKLGKYFTKPHTKLVLDISDIAYIDSSGFGAFLAMKKVATNSFGTFSICGVSKEIMELFKLLHLQEVFDIYEDCDKAVSSMNND